MASDLPLIRSAWQDRLATLPGSPDSIPPLFYGHGSPLLLFSKDVADRDTRWSPGMIKHWGPESPLANFLRDFGPALLAKYQPKGILVFSAHWETQGEQLGMSFSPSAAFDVHCYCETVTDYGDENPILIDYYNFDPELYKVKFSSHGDTTLSKRVVELFQNVRTPVASPQFLLGTASAALPYPFSFLQAGISARLTTKDETRGLDGRGFEGPGFDHGVFVAFKLMFGEDFHSVPIVQASIDGSMSPEGNWALGKAITSLRCV